MPSEPADPDVPLTPKEYEHLLVVVEGRFPRDHPLAVLVRSWRGQVTRRELALKFADIITLAGAR
jgi:hypothetical protein